jgi:hypothetical protein
LSRLAFWLAAATLGRKREREDVAVDARLFACVRGIVGLLWLAPPAASAAGAIAPTTASHPRCALARCLAGDDGHIGVGAARVSITTSWRSPLAAE